MRWQRLLAESLSCTYNTRYMRSASGPRGAGIGPVHRLRATENVDRECEMLRL